MTIEYTEPRAPKASRTRPPRAGVLLLVVGFVAAVVSLLAVMTGPDADTYRTLATGCSEKSRALSAAEKEYGGKSATANSVRADYSSCVLRLKAAQEQAPTEKHRKVVDGGASLAMLGLGIGAVMWLSAGSRVTDLGERARVQYHKARGLPPKEPTIAIPAPAPRVEPVEPEPFQQTFPLDEVVDYPEDVPAGDTDAEPVVDETPRSRSGWGTASKHKLTFGDGDDA